MLRQVVRICLITAAGVIAAGVTPTWADAPAIAGLDYSADIGANLVDANTFVARKDFVIDDLSGTRVRRQITGLPDNAILRDFHIEPNDNILLALDIGVSLGGSYYAPADVIRYNGSFTREFDSAAAGVPPGVHCDGIARWGTTGKLLLSFDRTFTAGGIAIRPADVIVYSAGGFGPKVVDATALGIPDDYNIDAIDTFRTRRYVLASFDSGGSIGGIAFTSADIMQLDRASGTWSKRYSPSTFSDRWNKADLDGLAAFNVDTIFEDDLE
jgi:hypothetical protein